MIFNSIFKWFRLRFSSSNQSPLSEDEYYTYLFTKNHEYSSKVPNNEEMERWLNIKILLEKAVAIKGGKNFETIIDFGCGRGWLSNIVSDYGNVVAIEPVENVVEYARSLYPHIDFHVGSFEVLKEFKGDLVISSEVLEHFEVDQRTIFFQKSFDALNNNGFCIITTPRKEVLKEWSRFSDPSQPIEEWLSELEVNNYAKNTGFEIVDKLTYSIKPIPDESAPLIEVYQQWLFRKP